ncbi:hypothetical protein TYRP_018492 [Tyrophagus putrescentiae]|nr:hypothetical protein TYRP_018492 [Tyrophagus putrescentiae]
MEANFSRCLHSASHLQRKVVIANVLLVDAQHGQQHVEQVSYAVGRNTEQQHNNTLREVQAPVNSSNRQPATAAYLIRASASSHPRREALEEDLVEEHDRLRVEEDRVDLVVAAGRLLTAGGHLEGPQKAADHQLQLLQVLLLRLDHAKDEAWVVVGGGGGDEVGKQRIENDCFRINTKSPNHPSPNYLFASHILRMRTVDVLIDDALPPTAAEPAPKEGLHLLIF